MTIQFSILDGGVAHVLIDRPESLNALDTARKQALGRIWRDAAADDRVRAVVLSGAGPRAFCVGSDVKDMQRTGRQASTAILADAIPNIGCPIDKPVIAACHGFTLGMGLSLAIHCDVRLAAADTQFGFPEAAHGMISGISAVTLPHLIGQGPAMEMMLSGRRVLADEALRIGLVHQVVARDVLAAALEYARRLASFPPVAVAATKRLLLLELRHQVRRYMEEIDAARIGVADAARLDARPER